MHLNKKSVFSIFCSMTFLCWQCNSDHNYDGEIQKLQNDVNVLESNNASLDITLEALEINDVPKDFLNDRLETAKKALNTIQNDLNKSEIKKTMLDKYCKGTYSSIAANLYSELNQQVSDYTSKINYLNSKICKLQNEDTELLNKLNSINDIKDCSIRKIEDIGEDFVKNNIDSWKKFDKRDAFEKIIEAFNKEYERVLEKKNHELKEYDSFVLLTDIYKREEEKQSLIKSKTQFMNEKAAKLINYESMYETIESTKKGLETQFKDEKFSDDKEIANKLKNLKEAKYEIINSYKSNLSTEDEQDKFQNISNIIDELVPKRKDLDREKIQENLKKFCLSIFKDSFIHSDDFKNDLNPKYSVKQGSVDEKYYINFVKLLFSIFMDTSIYNEEPLVVEEKVYTNQKNIYNPAYWMELIKKEIKSTHKCRKYIVVKIKSKTNTLLVEQLVKVDNYYKYTSFENLTEDIDLECQYLEPNYEFSKKNKLKMPKTS